MKRKNLTVRNHSPPTSWDDIADWYDGWMGQDGGAYHRQVAIPALLDLLQPVAGERVLDIGAGQGVVASVLQEAGMVYVGLETSSKLVRQARKRHPNGRFLQGDARSLAQVKGINAASFDTAVFLLSIQDIYPLDAVLRSVAWALKPGGRLVILMTHPCFRVPRQSGWGWDKQRKLRYRRIDRYLTALGVPMKAVKQNGRSTKSFHRPLQTYINGLAACGLLVDRVKEIPLRDVDRLANGRLKANKRASAEIPLFLGIRARKLSPNL
ncbi:hypothetical protein MNBD_CHLOROFLEXI01-403 [hydrothermal vent metagenome]|uniref:Methyltransferase type 11 domain-containing protein n=1 Tax=hydrothermal vent metagenome TaxID=652676 RepID=A0A3B0UMQ7_9ZZZZ